MIGRFVITDLKDNVLITLEYETRQAMLKSAEKLHQQLGGWSKVKVFEEEKVFIHKDKWFWQRIPE